MIGWQRAFLWLEGLARAAWLAAALLAGAAGLVLLGVPVPLGRALALAALGGAAVMLARRRAWLGWPTVAAAERRIERASGLRHGPLSVGRDAPAGGAGLLWAAHQAWAQQAASRGRLGAPAPALAEADPRALRALAALLLLAGIGVAGAGAPARLAGLLPGGALGGAPVIEAWIEPPAYTGEAPVFLTHGAGAVTVPADSRLKVSIGAGSRPWLAVPGGRARFRTPAAGAWTAEAPLRRSGRLRLGVWWHTLGAWKITILPNAPPDVAWDGAPGRAARPDETRLPWRAGQRWGVASLQAELRPAGHPDLPPLTVPVPLPGRPREAHGAAVAALAAHPYAGLRVTGVLRGRDVSGQAGASAAIDFVLPARTFRDPLARAVIEVRRRLALRPAAPGAAADDLEALAGAPEARARRPGTFLNLSTVAALLREGGQPAEAEAQARLWTLALDLEGALPDAAAARLAAAQDAARRALTDRQLGRIGDKKLAEMLQALRDAVQQRLADIARKAFERGELGQFDPRGKSFRSSDIDRLMQQIARDAAVGQMQAARQEMAELKQLLQRLDHAKVLSPAEAARAAAANRQAERLSGAVQDLARREAGLMDRGQQRAPRPAPMPQGWGQEGAPPPPDLDKLERDEAARGVDARTERALERALQALKQGAKQLGAEPPPSLDEAARAMQQAEQSLQQGNDAGARAAEGRAVASLMQGGQQLQAAMRQGAQMAIVPGGGGEGEELGAAPDGEGRDPLGRPVSGSGGRAEDDGSVKVPTDMELGRSRAIQEELRRRGAERTRPAEELDYIDRLLRGE